MPGIGTPATQFESVLQGTPVTGSIFCLDCASAMINAFSASLQQPMPGIGTPGMHSSAALHSGKPFSPTGLVCSAGCTTPPVAGAACNCCWYGFCVCCCWICCCCPYGSAAAGCVVTAPAIGYWYGLTGTWFCVCVGATSAGVNVAVSQHPMPGYGTPAMHPIIGLHCTPLSMSTGQDAGGFDKSTFVRCASSETPPSAGVANGCPVCGSIATAACSAPGCGVESTCPEAATCCCTAYASWFTHCGLAVSNTFGAAACSCTAGCTAGCACATIGSSGFCGSTACSSAA